MRSSPGHFHKWWWWDSGLCRPKPGGDGGGRRVGAGSQRWCQAVPSARCSLVVFLSSKRTINHKRGVYCRPRSQRDAVRASAFPPAFSFPDHLHPSHRLPEHFSSLSVSTLRFSRVFSLHPRCFTLVCFDLFFPSSSSSQKRCTRPFWFVPNSH